MPNRIVDLTSGITMVVTDLHGDRDAFGRYVGRFLRLHSRKQVQRLLLMGDLIHSDGPETQDASLQLVLDVMRMRNALPPGSVIMLLGNHEMPHLYGVSLAKGQTEYTPRFEWALAKSGQRREVMAFLDSLPFYVRTAAGVMFTHAGPHGSVLENLEMLRQLDHEAVRAEYDYALKLNPHPEQLRNLYGQTYGMPYEVLAKHYLAVKGPDDERYDDLLRAFMISNHSPEFRVLWDALFTRCEHGMAQPFYQRLLESFLAAFSDDGPAVQRFLVTGHITVQGGHAVVTEQHLRLASAAHARPREAGRYLMLDCGKPIQSMDELVQSLDKVF